MHCGRAISCAFSPQSAGRTRRKLTVLNALNVSTLVNMVSFHCYLIIMVCPICVTSFVLANAPVIGAAALGSAALAQKARQASSRAQKISQTEVKTNPMKDKVPPPNGPKI